MKEYIIALILFILLLIVLFLIMYNENIEESFSNNDSYLYPVTGLSKICEEEDLYPSYMPKVCYMDGNLNSYANCKCEDKKGNCKICYPTIKKDSNNANVVYNAYNIS
jgi:hypothetical protein